MPVESGYNANTPTGIGLYGVLYTGFNTGTGAGTIVGITRGGVTFNPGTEFRNVGYDGQISPTRGLDRIVREEATIGGTLIEVTNANLLEILETGGATPATLQTAGVMLVTADYLVNFAVAFKRAGGSSYFGYNFPDAMVTEYDVTGQGSDGEVEVSFTVSARLVQGATPDETARAWAPFEV